MAKLKTFPVEVEYVVKRTLYVNARRPGGAAIKALTDEGWREATQYEEDAPSRPPGGAKVVKVRDPL
jgi:hypothetical protein